MWPAAGSEQRRVDTAKAFVLTCIFLVQQWRGLIEPMIFLTANKEYGVITSLVYLYCSLPGMLVLQLPSTLGKTRNSMVSIQALFEILVYVGQKPFRHFFVFRHIANFMLAP